MSPSAMAPISIDEELEFRHTRMDQLELFYTVIESSRSFFLQFDSSIGEIRGRDGVAQLIERIQNLEKLNTGIGFGLWRQDQLLGHFGIHNMSETHQKAQVGYWMASNQAGKGYASKALRALVDFGFKTFNLQRVEATTATTNHASIRLLERTGFQREGLLRSAHKIGDRFVDDFIYSVLRSEWS
jgi:RimJ/RimL family protein N-acetyltransferase